MGNMLLPRTCIPQLQELLAATKPRCRCLLLWSLDFEFDWRLATPCYFHRVVADSSGNCPEKYDLLETTWLQAGRFCIYIHLPDIAPTITRETAAEARRQRHQKDVESQ